MGFLVLVFTTYMANLNESLCCLQPGNMLLLYIAD